MDADRRVAGAGAAGHHQHPGLAGELAIGLGHEGRTPFLAARHKADVGCVEPRIEDFEVAFAGDAKGHVDTMSAKCCDDKLTAAEKSLVRRHEPTSTPCGKTAI